MYNLYRYDLDRDDFEKADDMPFYIKSVRAGLFNLSLPNEKPSISKKALRALFSVITFGKFWIYYVVTDKNEIVHTSYLLGKCYKFPFMSKNDYEIGPCVTKKQFRGKGIYPNVIRYIISDVKDKAKTLYMFCNESNYASIRGIVKAGFKDDGNLERNAFKIYVRK